MDSHKEKENIFGPILDKIKQQLQLRSFDSYWTHVQSLINVIKEKCNENDEKIYDLISSKTISDFKTGFELIVVWGIAPRLCNGIGIDPNKRIDKDSKWLVVQSEPINEDEKLSQENCNRLYQCADCLLKAAKIDSFFRSVIFEYYFADILCALIQLIYAPKPKSIQSIEMADVKQLSANASPASLFISKANEKKYGLDSAKVANCSEILDNLLKNTPETVLVHNLLVLISQKSIVNSSKWFTQICTSFLSKTIMRPKGVFAVTNSMLEGIPETNLSKYEKVAQLVLKKPNQCPSLNIYYKHICPQIIQLLHLQQKSKFSHVIRAAQLYAGTIVEHHPELAKKHLLNPIFNPLIQFMEFGDRPYCGNREDIIIVDESQLVQCVEDIHQLLHGNAPTVTLFNSITQVIPALFQLYVFVSRTKLYLKHACEEIMASFFKISNKALDTIKSLLAFERSKLSTFTIFAGGETGGICIKRVKESQRDYLWEARCVINLLKLMKNETVAGDLFVFLMTQFTLMQNKVEELDEFMKSQLGVANEASLSAENAIILKVLQLLMDELGPSIMKNTLQTIMFIKFLILNHEKDYTENGIEMMTMGLGILSTIICGAIPVRTLEEEQLLYDLQPILQRLSTEHPNEQVTEMAATTNLGIATKQYKQYSMQKNREVSKEELLEARLRNILNDLKDPILPVKAHGVRMLREFVMEKNNPLIMKYKDKILRIFQTQLRDDDSYVYLGAIQGLSAMADLFPEYIIPILTNSYEDTKLPCTERLKIGEALLEVAERCGEILPKFAHLFVFTFLKCSQEVAKQKNTAAKKTEKSDAVLDADGKEIINSVNDDSSIIRASSLSNLSDVTNILKYGIHPYVSDILVCACSLVEKDTSFHVRRAALHIFSKLITTLGADIFNLFYRDDELSSITFLEDEVIMNPLSNIIKVLKRVQVYDKDELVKVNAKSILIELHEIIYEKLLPKEETSFHFAKIL